MENVVSLHMFNLKKYCFMKLNLPNGSFRVVLHLYNEESLSSYYYPASKLLIQEIVDTLFSRCFGVVAVEVFILKDNKWYLYFGV